MNINTLIGYQGLKRYYGEDKVVPIYIQVEDGIRLQRALDREKTEQKPKYKELCRRFLADQEDFSEENLMIAGINKIYINDDLFGCIHQISSDMNGYLEKEKQYRI